MESNAAAPAPLSLKLLVDSKAQRVLFAEAGKDAVDFLFSLLALPVGTAAKLLGADSMVGSVGDLYASVAKLDDTYVLPGANLDDALLLPAMTSPAAASLLRLPPSPSKRFFGCSQRHGHMFGVIDRSYVTDASGTKCPSCGKPMTDVIYWADPDSGQDATGFVQGIVTYTVMDNLAVTPMSAISSIELLNTFAVTDLGALQHKNVQIGYKEGLAILKASLKSKTVLTDVFLGKEAPGCKTENLNS
ncbi:unnamed protein product [Alopecurus aequalis]